MYTTASEAYDSVVYGPLNKAAISIYLETNSAQMLDFIRCRLMSLDANMPAIVYIYSLIVEAGSNAFSIPLLWDYAFEQIVRTLINVPEDELSYSLVREHIFYNSYLFSNPNVYETLRHALTMLSDNPMASPLWCMITQAIMECAPTDKKRDLCVEELKPSCSKGEFIQHVLMNTGLNY